jgi:hypothetical protein
MSDDTIAEFRKDPDAYLDFPMDWNAWLTDGRETVSTAVWTVPTGLTLGTETLADNVAVAWISGGTAGEVYTVSCKVTSSSGRIDERSIVIVVEER